MIADLLLRWFTTALFAFSAAECTYSLLHQRHNWVATTGHAIHIVMSVLMLVMAWPWGLNVPNIEPMIFFVFAAVWFVVVIALPSLDAQRAKAGSLWPRTVFVNAYHVVMMVAMAWMYAIMEPGLLPGTHMHSMGVPKPAYITVVNWVVTIVFAIATAYWLYTYFAARHSRRRAPLIEFSDRLSQACMAAGMAIMFGVTL